MGNNNLQFQIIDWKHYQHYKNRKPPWIKLHRELSNNQEWRNLSADASKLLIDLWLITADKGTDGIIEISLNKLAWRLRYASNMLASIVSWLEEIKQQDFIEFDSNLLATCLQRATPETEKRRDREECEEPKYGLTSDEVRLAELLYELMKGNDPKAKEPNIQNWASSINGLIRLDGRSVSEIEQVIRWSQKDDFWHTNILSASKLRKKYPDLRLKMNETNRPGSQIIDVIPEIPYPEDKV